MYWLKSAFEKVLWNSRMVVLFAVITSVLAGIVLFCVIGIESLRVLLNMLHYADPTMAPDQREVILRQSILREIALIDGYLLGAFMFIFGFGLYELFLADFQEARSSQASGRILRIKSLDDLKTRPELEGMTLLRRGRLSVQPVEERYWNLILQTAR